jgi:hypothetical protein
MQTLLVSFPALAVSALYCFWRTHYLVRQRRQQQLCERVAHMLWVLSQLPDANEPGGGRCGPDQPTPLYPHRPLLPRPKGMGR